MPGVFICYRREDSAGWTGRIYDRMVTELGSDRVFLDVDAIAPGEDFAKAVADILGETDSVAVVIGPRWLDALDTEGRRRLDDPSDNVRSEIAAALELGLRIVPVLVDGARMPTQRDLPDAIKPLALRNAVDISDVRFGHDMGRLLTVIGDEADFPRLRPSSRELVNLPVQVTSFVGRVRESAELEKLIRSSRLVTITGAGGCGKSRTAVHVAAELIDDFPDGVCLVDLAPLIQPDLLVSTAVTAVGMREESGRGTLDLLTTYLRGRTLLMILDNCEHLVEAAAGLVAHLLAQTAAVRVVATSREPLRVRGEARYHLPTLPVPAPNSDIAVVAGSEAVQLFSDRARAVTFGFQITEDNAGTVASICSHLDGIPLAIELAASASGFLGPDQIEQRLNDRFRFLTGGARDDVGHHRTLEAAIDWSFRLLTPEQQHVFERLGIFAGGFSMEAAESVCADEDVPAASILANVVEIADRSLLEVEETDVGIRYRMLETIHSFAAARLQELPDHARQDLNERHGRYMLALAEQAAEGPVSADPPPPWLAELDAATPDLRQALARAIETHRDQQAVDLAGALGFYWHVRKRRTEAAHWYQAIPLHSTTVTVASRIRAMREAAGFLAGSGPTSTIDMTSARELAEESLVLARHAGEPGPIAASLLQIGAIAFGTGSSETVPILDEAVAAARVAGDQWLEAWIKHFLALHYRESGSIDAAKALFEANLDTFRQLGDDRMVAFTLGFLGMIANLRGEHSTAAKLGEESLRIGRILDIGAIGNALGVLGTAHYLGGDLEAADVAYGEMVALELQTTGVDLPVAPGIVAYARGDYAAAREYLRRSLSSCRELDLSDVWTRGVMRRSLWGVGSVLAREGAARHAAVLFAAVEAAADAPPWIDEVREPADYRQCVALIESALSSGDLGHARHQGASMTLDHAIDYTLNLLNKTAPT